MAASLKVRFAKDLFIRSLKNLRFGTLELVCPRETYVFGDASSGLHATIAVEDENFFARAMTGGDIGIGESYMDGQWASPDIGSVIHLGIRNLTLIEKSHPLLSALTRLKNRWAHRRRANTMEGSSANVSYHYDLGNDFYSLFLDRTMAYSCAYYSEASDSLEEAQLRKFDRICSKLRIAAGDRVLEIGTGWGGFAIHAARNYGCHVTTTTISSRQHEYATDWVARTGLQDRIQVFQSDYRELRGSYDKIVSIEMFEAVGYRYYDDFFTACDRLLEPKGKMLIQTITMNENRFADYLKSCDWIQKYIFPGGELASVAEVLRSIARATSLSMCESEDIGLHYVHTLNAWRERFHAALPHVRQLGFDDRFIRMWDYYLAYCAAAFAERHISDIQLVFAKDRTSGQATRTQVLAQIDRNRWRGRRMQKAAFEYTPRNPETTSPHSLNPAPLFRLSASQLASFLASRHNAGQHHSCVSIEAMVGLAVALWMRTKPAEILRFDATFSGK